ncbi:uncharacterized protein [Prorops nasuta]|uniref:uncharacterized protein isoform X2 n=1 Tax=Prorops nasuta TaxID=863751 RepID=UPI0034CD418B
MKLSKIFGDSRLILTIVHFVSFTNAILAAQRTRYHPCLRTCQENRTMTCHYHFHIERYVTMGTACNYCHPNTTVSQLMKFPVCQCVFADGFERAILTINRLLPGPSIQVCKGDTIIVDVHNQIDGQSTSIHWHGLHQKGTPYFDGVPFITQCPIPGGTNFRYNFKADKSGSHFYHSHSNVQLVDGIYGALIIREPHHQNYHKDLYDEDLPEHVFLLSDFMHVMGAERIPGYSYSGKGQYPESFLINGLGRYRNLETGSETATPYEVFTVQEGARYRFRLINSIGTSCEARITFEGHPLTMIASDGDDFDPITVDSIVFYSGERFDVILHANQTPKTYWIHVMSPKGCLPKGVHQLAVLRYEGHSYEPKTTKPTYAESLPGGKSFIDICDKKHLSGLCHLRSVNEESLRITERVPDHQIILPYEMFSYEKLDPFRPNTYNHFLGSHS